jgi:hypothetical protein
LAQENGLSKGNIMHPDEPTLEVLNKLYRELSSAKSTDDNVKKLEALDKQIDRRRAEGEPTPKEETVKAEK